MKTNDVLLADIEQKSEEIRELLGDFARAQNEDSDEGNEDAIYSATAALDSFDASVSGMVP